jgi:hypothetical protein
MNTPGQTPPVTDLIIRLKGEGPKDWEGAYKPFRVKKLRNYRGDGYYPQRNGRFTTPENCMSNFVFS